MLYTITKGLEICININLEISKVDHYTYLLLGFLDFALQITVSMGVLQYICCIFSEHIFLRKTLVGCF